MPGYRRWELPAPALCVHKPAAQASTSQSNPLLFLMESTPCTVPLSQQSRQPQSSLPPPPLHNLHAQHLLHLL
ncbi:unnamed protein product [Closterium sp. NIES-54]